MMLNLMPKSIEFIVQPQISASGCFECHIFCSEIKQYYMSVLTAGLVAMLHSARIFMPQFLLR